MITYGLCQMTTGYEKIQRNDLWLLSMFEDRHHNGYANVAWVIAKWMKRKGAGSQKDNQICCGQFISKISRKSRVLIEEIICSLSTPVYCRDFDRTTLREFIDSEVRLIPDIPVDDVPRVAAQRAQRIQRDSMQDLYERMGSMEIRQEAIERMEVLTTHLTSGAYDHEAESYRAKRSRNVETVEEALLLDVYHEFLEWRGCSREAKSRYNSRLATLLPKLIYLPQIVDWQLLHKIGCRDEIDQMLKFSLKEAQTEDEVFFFVAWVRAFNIREPIYPELCREFYATYEFDEVCADNELQSKKIISFRLGGRAHSLTLLEFARRLGLYHADELEEEGFDTYFQGGLRSDENFNAREYWERISLDRDLHLSRSSITSVRFPILRVLHKMITYGLCQRTTGYEKIQRNDL
ncbi:hypothetical protein Tco_0059836 [Tanacetum coccineum]